MYSVFRSTDKGRESWHTILKISFVYGFDAFMMLFEKSYIFFFTYIISESFQDAFAFRILMLSFGQKISTKSKELRRDIFISEETPCHD